MPIMFNAPSPIGTIIIWSGTLATIPGGWILCDGTGGTPDLRETFVRSVPDNVTNPGGTGGIDTHVVTESQMPIHNHTLTDPNHKHDYGSGGIHRDGSSTALTSTANALASPSIVDTGSSTAHENRPAFFEVAYIQKVSDNG